MAQEDLNRERFGPWPLVKDHLCLVPILHGRMEFSLALRDIWATYHPEAVAVELPRSLKPALGPAVERLPRYSVILCQGREGQDRPPSYLLVEPTDPIMEGLRRAGEEGLPWFCVDAEPEGDPPREEPWPDPYALTRVGLAAFSRPFLDHPPPPGGRDLLRERTMAHRLQELGQRFKRVLFICGLAHAGRIRSLLDRSQPLPLGRTGAGTCRPANLEPGSIKEVSSEIPYLVRLYEDWRSGEGERPDRLLGFEALYQEAALAFSQATGEELRPWQYKVLRKFRRNWALLSGSLSPDFYQLVVAAKGVGGDEFAHFVYKQAVEYPWTEFRPDWETIRLTAADLGRSQRKVSFFKPLRRTRRRLMPLPERPLLEESFSGQWAQAWAAGSGICSHPPEDLLIEDFGRRSARKALARLAEANRLVEPFTVSLRDGIDLRETLRRLAEERVYVYEERSLASKVGAVVIVFDPDEPAKGEEERFPWKLTWLGERQDESDMALYATPPGFDLVGPGISRCVYGGLVMTYPPLRMLDIWTDPFFEPARTKAERLLLAGADYSQERVVAYVARTPPSARARSFVQRMGRQVAYLPLGIFGSSLIQKIRVFHVLAGHEVRERAAEYLDGTRGGKGKGGSPSLV